MVLSIRICMNPLKDLSMSQKSSQSFNCTAEKIEDCLCTYSVIS